MFGNKNSRGVKHRLLIMIYVACLMFSLVPRVVAPSERGFSQGQPEMQQAMDNMVVHGVLMKKSTGPPVTDIDYPALLTSKTSNLLNEAEQVLHELPDSKEKQWIEEFVNRMRAIAMMLEKTAENGKQRLVEKQNSVSGTPVPMGLPIQPTWPTTVVVPGYNPYQRPNRMISKFPVTSPELSKVLPVNEYPTERQAVTKPAVLSNDKGAEDDELVRELQSLREETAPQASFQNSMVLEKTPDLTSTATPESVPSKVDKNDNPNTKEAEKNMLKSRLIEEITEFQRLGGTVPKGLINAFRDNEKTKSDFKSPIAKSNQNQVTAVNIVETMKNPGMKKEAMERVHDENSGDKHISKSNVETLSSEGNEPRQSQKQPIQFKPNHQFQNSQFMFHPDQLALAKQVGNNLPQTPLQVKEQHLPVTTPNAIRNPQHSETVNFQGIGTNDYPKTEAVTHIPGAIKRKIAESNYNAYRHYLQAYNNFLAQRRYGFSPMYRNNNITTFNQFPNVVPAYKTKPTINHQIDTQLSDEMKRQLRDGKIIVLSDSLVRSNFEQKQDHENGTNGRKSEGMNNDNTTEVLN